MRQDVCMVTITIRGAQGYLNGLPPEAIDPLTNATSFRPAGFQFTKAFRKGFSDGRVRLLRHSKFPAGLLSTVVRTLRAQDVPYELHQERTADTKPDLSCKLVGIQDRWYQDEAVEMAILNPRGVIRAPTGAGKTAMGARIIHARHKWAMVVVPTLDLLHQYKQFLSEHIIYTCRIGQLGDGVVDPQPITVATVRTASKVLGVAYEKYEYGEYDDTERETDVSPTKLRDWIEKIGTLIVDEVHIVGAKTAYDVATKLPAPNKYGMSASPWRDDGADLMIEGATGPVIYEIGVDALVRDGYLVPPIIRVVNTKGWWIPAAWGQTCSRCKRQRPMGPKGPVTQCECGNENWRSEFGDAYRHEIVENAVRNMRIAQIVETECIGPTLVLVKQVNHGKMFQQLIPGSRFLSGKDTGTERAKVYDQMRAGRLRVIIATTIADMGLDLPILRNLVLAGGGKSSTRHLQRIGRTARPYPDKTSALVIDFDDGHIHKWFRDHARARRKIEKAEWAGVALWI